MSRPCRRSLRASMAAAVVAILSGVGPGYGAETASRGVAGAGVSTRSGALYSTLDLGLDTRWRDFTASLRVPGQFMVTTGRSDTQQGFLREKDWDERSEWLRLAPRLAWRRQARDGALTAVTVAPLAGTTLGHGSVMHHYYGGLRTDRFKSGARVQLRRAAFGLDLVTDDVTRARIIAGRAYVTPFASRRKSVMRTFTIGATAAADRFAPTVAHKDARGRPLFDPTGALQADTARVVIAGLDLGIEPWRGRNVSLFPYLDGTFASVAGRSGFAGHAGLRLALFTDDARSQIALRYEIRTFDGAALPGWFDAMYEVEQARWLARGPLVTKAQAAIERPSDVITGHHFAATAQLGAAKLTTSLELHPDTPGLDTAGMWLDVPWTASVQWRAMVTKRRFSGLGALLQQGSWTAATTLLAEVVPPFSAYIEVQRAWHVDPQAGLRTSLDGAFGIVLRRSL